jgi:Alginate export
MAVVSFLAAHAAAQDDPANPYRPNAADEDWTFLKDAPKTDFWDPVKYIELGPEDWSLTLSGEARLRAEGFRVRDTATPGPKDNYLLQRYLFGTDLRFGRRVRIFTEIQAGVINGQVRSPRPTDENLLDFHQAFLELRLPVREKNQMTFVVGRQELEIGSSRLISASPGLNVKRSFDGVATSYRTPSFRVAGAVAKLVDVRSGFFDDPPDPNQLFWGVAAAGPWPGIEGSEAGTYYLGIDNRQSVYAQGLGPEIRHTVGARWRSRRRVDVNYDVVFQWGRFAEAPVRAWAVATETGYRLSSAWWQPRLSFRVDVASGDSDAASAALQSFNPLFPGNSYSGAVGLLGPTNLTDFTPALTMIPRPGLVLGVEAPSYWRTSTGDGVYNTELRVLLRPQAGEGKYVGTNPAVLVVWQATRQLQFQAVATRFLSGPFLGDTFIANGFGFYSFTTRYRF